MTTRVTGKRPPPGRSPLPGPLPGDGPRGPVEAGRGVFPRLTRRVRAVQGVKVALVAWTVLGLVSLAAVFADAVVVLPAAARALAPWTLSLLAGGLVVAGVFRLVRTNDLAVARRLETARPELGSVMTNAVELAFRSRRSSGGTGAGGAIEAVLRSQAVELGRRRAEGLRVWPLERRAARALAIAAAASAALWCASGLVFTDVLGAVLPRFFDPRGDHPPYSRLSFEVAPGDVEIHYGGQVEIRASAAGRPLERLYLVAGPEGAAGEGAARTIMFLAPGGSFFQTVANLRERTEYFVTDGRARSRRFTIDIKYVPRITMAEIRAKLPEHTGMRPRTLSLVRRAPQGAGEADTEPGRERAPEFRLPLDSRLTFRVASNRPLGSGEVKLTPIMGGESRTIRLKAREEGETVVHGGFLLEGPVAFSVRVADTQGLASARPVRGRITILPDERPRVFVVEPGKHAVATPEAVVPVRVQAEDDYALEKIIWFRGHNRSAARPHEMEFGPGARGLPRSAEARAAFDLDGLGVRPGDVIEYYVEAVDNCPRGPNLATSRIYRLEIISAEQYREILRMMAAREALFQTYDSLGAWLKRLAERAGHLEEKARESPGWSDELAREAGRLAEDIGEYRQALVKALGLPEMFDVEKHLKRSLSEQRRRLERLEEEIKASASTADLAALARAARGIVELGRYERETVGEPVRHVKAVVQVLARANRFVTLTLGQRTLVKMAGRFAEHEGGYSRIERAEMRELAHVERATRRALDGILAELPGLVAELPEDPAYDDLRATATGFLQGVREAEIPRDLAGASRGFDALDGRSASRAAASALEKMERFVKKCSGGGFGVPDCRTVFQPTLAEAMSNSVRQILAAMGAGSGSGAGGQGGYSMVAGDVALYGPGAEMAGGAGELAGAGAAGPGGGAGRPTADFRRDATDARDPGLVPDGGAARAKLEPDARFPLRYRDLVGEYFRAVAEAFAEEQ